MMTIKANDFQVMREEYEDVLRMRNFDTFWINKYLNQFDEMVVENRTDEIVALMESINIKLI